VWDAKEGCQHEWGDGKIINRGHPGDKSTLVGTQTANISKAAGNQGQFCFLCGAWRGSLGLEPTPDCGRPLMELRDDLTDKEKEYVLQELKNEGLL